MASEINNDSDELKLKIYELYLSGNSEYEISQKTNVPRSTVNNWINKYKETIEHRISELALEEFQLNYLKTKDAVESNIKRLSDELANEVEKGRRDRLDNMIHQRRMDFWKLLNEAEIVLIVRRMKKKLRQQQLENNVSI